MDSPQGRLGRRHHLCTDPPPGAVLVPLDTASLRTLSREGVRGLQWPTHWANSRLTSVPRDDARRGCNRHPPCPSSLAPPQTPPKATPAAAITHRLRSKQPPARRSTPLTGPVVTPSRLPWHRPGCLTIWSSAASEASPLQRRVRWRCFADPPAFGLGARNQPRPCIGGTRANRFSSSGAIATESAPSRRTPGPLARAN